MLNTAANNLLNEHLPNPPIIIGGRSLRHDIDDLVAQAMPKMRLCVVDDVNTEAALGNNIFQALKTKFSATHLTLKNDVLAGNETVEYIRAQTQNADALVAVGSGTINDLCKYAAHLDKKPYLVFPTAASMNGYVSANASITFDGYKKTVAAQLPQAVFCDYSIIAAAPIRLSKSGLGDALARPTAQADWLLSHHLLGTLYNNIPFELVAPFEAELFDSARGIAKADPASIELLMKISLLSGFGMTIAGGSYPASQGEHMIAHTMDMLALRRVGVAASQSKPLKFLHGEEIGVTSLYMARLQERILRSGGRVSTEKFDSHKITGLFGDKTAQNAKPEFQKKLDASLRWHDTKIDWDKLRETIAPISLPPIQLEAILLAAETFTKPEDLGWNELDCKTATSTARYLRVRDRFTFLDINPD